VIRNIAYRLASFDGRISKAVVAAINSLPSIAESPLPLQFNKLIVEPLLRLPPDEAPILIVLDGLDECGNAESRGLDISVCRRISMPSRLYPYFYYQ
jgi:hypothetical protein